MQKAETNGPKKGNILFYWVGIVTLLLLLTAATYTWFSLSRTPRVSDLYLNVVSPVGLQIAAAYDAPDEEWGQVVAFSDLVSEETPLKPCTWSDSEGRFYGAIYGADGRLTGRWTPLTDEENANTQGANGYYVVGTVYARTDTRATVSLSDAVTLEDGTESAGTYLIGTPVWNEQSVVHDDGGAGGQYAVRIGLRVAPVDENGETTDADAVFYIYEPNCDGHLDGETAYTATASIDGTETLVPAERLITQTTSSWEEAFPAQRTATIRTMGEFTEDSELRLFELPAGVIERIDLYVWLEGQDVDCSNLLSADSQILANIQFFADFSWQSGLVPID